MMPKRAKKPTRYELAKEQGDLLRAAPIVETLGEFRDVYDRAYSRVSVELCHGIWCTFARQYSYTADSYWRQHSGRDEARAYARAWLAR